MKLRWMMVIAIAVAGCDEEEGTEACGAVPSQCDGVFSSASACPDSSELCRPDTCGSFDCCWCGSGGWQVTYIDCFEGCPGNVDAGVDAEVDANVSMP